MSIEFDEKEVRFVKPNIKTKGDVLATAFGYLQDYETLKYLDIKKIELVEKGNYKLIKIETKNQIQMPVFYVPNNEAEEIKEFITNKMK